MRALAILILLCCAGASMVRVHLDASKCAIAWMLNGRAANTPSMRWYWQGWGFAVLALALAALAGWLMGRGA
jgi:hypothetical protein